MSEPCEHKFVNDAMFEDGTVSLETNHGKEMRQYCVWCFKVRYVPKEETK